MKNNFEESLKMVLEHEGLFSDHSADPGKVTMRGVTQAVWEDWVDHPVTRDDMKSLTVDDVSPLYKRNYWDRVHADDLPSGVDFCVFDMAVNSGSGRAAKILQKVVGASADGAIGPQTLSAVARMEPTDLIYNFTARREDFYRGLSTFETFGRGWLRRNEKTQIDALAMTEDK